MHFWRNCLTDPHHYNFYVVEYWALLHKNHSEAGLRDYFSKNKCSSNLDLPIYPDLESLSIPKPPIRKNSSKRISHINLTISRRFEIMSHEHRRRHVMMMKSWTLVWVTSYLLFDISFQNEEWNNFASVFPSFFVFCRGFGRRKNMWSKMRLSKNLHASV